MGAARSLHRPPTPAQGSSQGPQALNGQRGGKGKRLGALAPYPSLGEVNQDACSILTSWYIMIIIHIQVLELVEIPSRSDYK